MWGVIHWISPSLLLKAKISSYPALQFYLSVFLGRRWGDGFIGNLHSHLLYFHPSLMFPQLFVHPVHSFMVNNWTSLWSGREVEREEERPRSRNKLYLVSVKCCCPAVVLFLNGHICSEIWLRLEESFCFTVSTNLTINKQFLLIFLIKYKFFQRSRHFFYYHNY